MKTVYGVVLLASLLALAHSFPGAKRDSSESDSDDSSDGVLLVLPNSRRQSMFDDSSDSDESPMSGPWHPFRFDNSPFDNLFTRMQEAMNRIRAEMAASLASRLGQVGGLVPWGKIPEGANTTSTTKIIGDHAVTINETTYTDGDETGGTIFRVRIVDVKPLNETTEAVATEATSVEDNKNVDSEEIVAGATDKSVENNNDNREELSTPASRSVETLEEFDNEIPKQQVDALNA